EIAVYGFGAMHEEGRGTGGGQCGSHLACDMARLADAGHHDAAMAAQEHLHRLAEALVQAVLQRLQALYFCCECAAGRGQVASVPFVGGLIHVWILIGIVYTSTVVVRFAFYGLPMHIDPAVYVRNAIRSVPDWPKPGITF